MELGTRVRHHVGSERADHAPNQLAVSPRAKKTIFRRKRITHCSNQMSSLLSCMHKVGMTIEIFNCNTLTVKSAWLPL